MALRFFVLLLAVVAGAVRPLSNSAVDTDCSSRLLLRKLACAVFRLVLGLGSTSRSELLRTPASRPWSHRQRLRR